MFVFLIIFFGCSNDNTNNQESPEEGNTEGNCYEEEGRMRIGFRENITGMVMQGVPDCPSSEYLIIPLEGSVRKRKFVPCNIAEAFQKDSLKVIFSGYDYDTSDLPDICAFPFEITEIKKYEP